MITPTPEITQKMLKVLQECFKQVRPYILGNVNKAEFTSKQDGSPVTKIDVKVEKIVTETMARTFPGIAVYGEESGYNDSLPSVCWLIDPIDGTESYINGLPHFTCMAVLIVGNEATACIVYNPTTNDTFTAQKGLGAFKNGERLNLGEKPLPSIAYCKGLHIPILNEILASEAVTCETAPSGAGYGFAAVAAGTSAARFQLHSRGYAHDYAPGVLLIKEAGGCIITLKEDVHPYTLRSFIACHPKLEPLLQKNIEHIRKLEV